MLEYIDFVHVLWMAFFVGALVGLLLTAMVVWACNQCSKDQGRPIVKLSLPGELFASRAGRCYHINKSCQNKDNNMVELKLCQICLKQYEKGTCLQKTK